MLFHRHFCEDYSDGVGKSTFKTDIEYIMNSGYFAINNPVSVENEACTWYRKVSMIFNVIHNTFYKKYNLKVLKKKKVSSLVKNQS